ncbi:hypothetical protein CFU_4218 [Collimonas fungivorans Ter331]|uniref:Uncharacterized protein n=1 Tax=Collimonas fungivorans (strain Ter331) TaxID=1005048 RepID=G0AEA9_COLFT|nr:hypothetical protein CFU_4218 [Collimonas fungivorans Ter331]
MRRASSYRRCSTPSSSRSTMPAANRRPTISRKRSSDRLCSASCSFNVSFRVMFHLDLVIVAGIKLVPELARQFLHGEPVVACAAHGFHHLHVVEDVGSGRRRQGRQPDRPVAQAQLGADAVHDVVVGQGEGVGFGAVHGGRQPGVARHFRLRRHRQGLAPLRGAAQLEAGRIEQADFRRRDGGADTLQQGVLGRAAELGGLADGQAVGLPGLAAAQHQRLLHDAGGALHVDAHGLDQLRVLGGAGRFHHFFDTVQHPFQRRRSLPFLASPARDIVELVFQRLRLVVLQAVQASDHIADRLPVAFDAVGGQLLLELFLETIEEFHETVPRRLRGFQHQAPHQLLEIIDAFRQVADHFFGIVVGIDQIVGVDITQRGVERIAAAAHIALAGARAAPVYGPERLGEQLAGARETVGGDQPGAVAEGFQPAVPEQGAQQRAAALLVVGAGGNQIVLRRFHARRRLFLRQQNLARFLHHRQQQVAQAVARQVLAVVGAGAVQPLI